MINYWKQKTLCSTFLYVTTIIRPQYHNYVSFLSIALEVFCFAYTPPTHVLSALSDQNEEHWSLGGADATIY